MKNITVIGAGNSGLATSGYLSMNGFSVRLWNRSHKTIKKLIKTKTIKVGGVSQGEARLDVVTTDINQAIENTDLIMVTTPANSHVDIANILKEHIDPDVPIILNPGRTFGALVFGNTLRESNSPLPIIAETQTIVFTCRKIAEDTSTILAVKKDVLISTLKKSDLNRIMTALPQCLKNFFKPTDSMIATSIGNVGMILHCTPVLLNAGWIEYKHANFKYYYNGITESIAHFLQHLDNERIEVSNKLGSPVEPLTGWLKRSYGVDGKNIYECIQNVKSYATIDAPKTLHHRYIFEDIPSGLVPLEAIGKKFGLYMNYTEIIINLASMLLETDFREIGRNLNNLGLSKLSNDELLNLLNRRI